MAKVEEDKEKKDKLLEQLTLLVEETRKLREIVERAFSTVDAIDHGPM